MEPAAYNLGGVSDPMKDFQAKQDYSGTSPNKVKTLLLIHQTSLSSSLPSTSPVISEEESSAGLKLCHQWTTVQIPASPCSLSLSLSFLIYKIGNNNGTYYAGLF